MSGDQANSAILQPCGLWRRAARPSLSGIQKSWLCQGGSLTQRLRVLGHVKVRVMREVADFAWPDESICLDARARLRVWAREVLLLVENVPYVAARSVTPLAASHGAWRGIRRLQARPLAEMVHRADVQRSVFISRSVDAYGHLGRFVHCCTGLSEPGSTTGAIAARRSVFMRRGAPLLVTECFLTALWIRLAAHGDK